MKNNEELKRIKAALNTLTIRYAKGEIGREEYEKLKKELERMIEEERSKLTLSKDESLSKEEIIKPKVSGLEKEKHEGGWLKKFLVVSIIFFVLALIVIIATAYWIGKEPERMYHEGENLQYNAQYKDAIAKYQTIAVKYPKSDYSSKAKEATAETYYEWGHELQKNKQYKYAIEKYNIIVDEYYDSAIKPNAEESIPQCYYEWGQKLQDTPVKIFVPRTEKQITMSSANQISPAIYDDKIVWQDYRNGNWDIYMYDLSTKKEKQITMSSANQISPAIYDDKIVWQDCRNGEYHYMYSIWKYDCDNWDIYLYDLSTKKEKQITTNKMSQSYPTIYDDKIVWQDYRNGNWDIYLYDLSTKKEKQITTHTTDQVIPLIYENRIIWGDYRNLNWDIYLYNLSSNIQRSTTRDSLHQYDHAIYENIVIWVENITGNYGVYMYNLSNNMKTKITENIANQQFPAMYGNKIVWQDYRNGNYDIYMYDLSTENEIQITVGSSHQQYPAMYGNKIVWQDYRNLNWDIYIVDLEPKTTIQYNDAIEKFMIITDKYSDSPYSSKGEEAIAQCYYEWGQELQDDKKYDDAVKKYRKILEEYPLSAYNSRADAAIDEIAESYINILLTGDETSRENAAETLGRIYESDVDKLLPLLDNNETVYVIYPIVIKIGKESTEDELIDAINKHIEVGFWGRLRELDEKMLEDYLNCGNKKLRESVEEWAERHNFIITNATSYEYHPTWGGRIDYRYYYVGSKDRDEPGVISVY
ncbi:hypothetical protein BEH94_11645 [Candidatus Altiarchaeales archaeon WOR_SM1_SCG]|nr:hypothetical protein BEH94_11645 [Candidatus Altiarchaeales archaeon WOR_SM1_SCG]